jgi:hypothetical protein
MALPDIDLKRRIFYRSDHYRFAMVGVPTLYVIGLGVPADENGQERRGGLLGALTQLGSTADELFTVQKRAEFFLANHYHQTSDVIRSNWDWTGVRTAAVFYAIAGLRVANADQMPSWQDHSRYNRPRGFGPLTKKRGFNSD